MLILRFQEISRAIRPWYCQVWCGNFETSSGCGYSGATILNNGVLQIGGRRWIDWALTNTAYITVASGAELQLNTPDDRLRRQQSADECGHHQANLCLFRDAVSAHHSKRGTITLTASNAYNEAYNFFGVTSDAGWHEQFNYGRGELWLAHEQLLLTNEAGSTLTAAFVRFRWTGFRGPPHWNKTGQAHWCYRRPTPTPANTVISAGTLALIGSGSIASSPIIDVERRSRI